MHSAPAKPGPYCCACAQALVEVSRRPIELPHLQDYVVKRLRSIPGLKLPEPEGAFYALPDMSQFFGHAVTADDFGSIPDIDTLCRQVPMLPLLTI